MKVIYLTNLPAPYKVEFFNLLGEKCELTVLFERQNANNRNLLWASGEKRKYREVFLRGLKVGEEDALSIEVLHYLKQNCDICVIGGYSTPTSILAILYCKLMKIKYILAVDGIIENEHKSIKDRIKSLLISNAEGYLVPGKNSKEILLTYGATSEKIYEYPFTSLKEKDINQLLPTNFEKTELRKQLGVPEKMIVLTVGQFIYRKGFDVLLNAIPSEAGDLGVYIIGGSIPLSEYQEIIKKRELKNIHFIEFKPKEELDKYYRAADVFVLPTREDIWGLVINEAMSKGLPIISTDRCGAALELVKPGINGWIVPIDNDNGIARCLSKIIDDNSLCKKMGNASLSIIKSYTLEEMALRYMSAFESIIERRIRSKS